MCALVTGVQTCALPISNAAAGRRGAVSRDQAARPRREAPALPRRRRAGILDRRWGTPVGACRAAGRGGRTRDGNAGEIGRASRRERVWQYGAILVGAVSIQKKKQKHKNNE